MNPSPEDDLPAVLIEAFSSGPFAGNGAAVVALNQPRDDRWLQAVAGSLRQSETAFLLQAPEGWMLRWFTPRCEVPLCGHATLAALLALGHWGWLRPGMEERLHSRSGPLPVRLGGDREGDPGAGQGTYGTIELPSGAMHPATVPPSLAALLHQRLGTGVEAFWRTDLGYSIALLAMEAPLATMEPLAAELEGELRQGLVLMQPPPPGDPLPSVAGQPADYQLRFFAPGLGIDEDPVTGSAHALVAPWWQRRLGRERVRGWQCSDRPGGMVCEGAGSAMIRLSGAGHLLWEGTLRTGSRSAAPACAQPWCPDWSAWRTATHLPCSAPSGVTPS